MYHEVAKTEGADPTSDILLIFDPRRCHKVKEDRVGSSTKLQSRGSDRFNGGKDKLV